MPGVHGLGDGVQQARIAAKVGETLAKIDGLVLLRQGRHGAEDGGAHLRQAAGEGGGGGSHGLQAVVAGFALHGANDQVAA